MALPAVLAGLIVAGAIGRIISTSAGIYQTQESTKNADYVNKYGVEYASGYRDENTRYWNDYIRRHHLDGRQIRYPYRTGYEYNLSQLYSSQMSLRNNELNRNMSWFRLFGGGGLGQGPSFYRGLYGGE